MSPENFIQWGLAFMSLVIPLGIFAMIVMWVSLFIRDFHKK